MNSTLTFGLLVVLIGGAMSRFSCTNRDMDHCFQETNSAKERCEATPLRLSCLMKLESICGRQSIEELDYQLGQLKEDLTSCESGSFKNEMEYEACNEMFNKECVDSFNAVVHARAADKDTKDLVKAAFSCVDNLVVCNGTWYAENLKDQLMMSS